MRPQTGALSGWDAALYRDIFTLQDQGDWDGADRLIQRLSDRRLRGHVLAQRYLHPDYPASFAELSSWMALYADHPQAVRISAMAVARQPKGWRGTLTPPKAANRLSSVIDRIAAGPARKRVVTRTVLQDRELAQRAAESLYSGRIAAARKMAVDALRRSGARAPLAGWVSGLAAWRQGDWRGATLGFSIAARSPHASPELAAAAAYWAHRAHVKLDEHAVADRFLQQAAQYPHQFYGLLALRKLGAEPSLNLETPRFGKTEAQIIAADPAGARAVALLQVERRDEAEAELRRLSGDPGTLARPLLGLAVRYQIPAMALRLGEVVRDDAGRPYDLALYPHLPREMTGPMFVDPSLVQAVVRQESRFRPHVVSPSGAVGLMQVMPATAKDMADGDPHDLKTATDNLHLGQSYLASLVSQGPGGDLLSLAAAYNAGPGRLSGWKRKLKTVDDPLLFIELIPVSETRAYVERVAANYWIYRAQAGQDLGTLDRLAADEWPRLDASDIARGWQLASE